MFIQDIKINDLDRWDERSIITQPVVHMDCGTAPGPDPFSVEGGGARGDGRGWSGLTCTRDSSCADTTPGCLPMALLPASRDRRRTPPGGGDSSRNTTLKGVDPNAMTVRRFLSLVVCIQTSNGVSVTRSRPDHVVLCRRRPRRPVAPPWRVRTGKGARDSLGPYLSLPLLSGTKKGGGRVTGESSLGLYPSLVPIHLRETRRSKDTASGSVWEEGPFHRAGRTEGLSLGRRR